MADYVYSPAPVVVETTGVLAIGATGVLYEADGTTPAQLYDLNDSPIPSVVVGPKGAHQAFKADIAYGLLDFGSVALPTISLEAMFAGIKALDRIVIHGDNPNVARPDLDVPVIWIGSVDPVNSSDTEDVAFFTGGGTGGGGEGGGGGGVDATTVRQIVAAQILEGSGIDSVVNVDTDEITLAVKYGSIAGTVVQGNDARVTADQAPGTASIRTLGTGFQQAAPGTHTHAATQISDSTAVGRTVLTSATAVDALSALGAAAKNRTEGVVFWEEGGAGTAWGASRPTGYKRIKFSANGSTSSTDPALTIALAGDIWERPA